MSTILELLEVAATRKPTTLMLTITTADKPRLCPAPKRSGVQFEGQVKLLLVHEAQRASEGPGLTVSDTERRQRPYVSRLKLMEPLPAISWLGQKH